MFFVAFVYCLAIFLAALAGGWVPLVVRLTHTRMQVALSFVAGVILGIGLLHLMPHAYLELNNIDMTVRWTLGGFLGMFFLERFFHFHHHEAPDPESPQDVNRSDAHGHEHCDHPDHHHSHGHHGHSHELSTSVGLSWSGALFGLALHSLIDGIALGAAIHVEAGESSRLGLAGLGTFLAVVLHKPFDSLTIGTLMAAGGWSRGARHVVNVLYALIAPLGVFAFFLGVQHLQQNYPNVAGISLCIAAGAFICIATSDLLPEVQFHSHDRGKLSIALLAGIALAAAIVMVESSGHDHNHGHGHQHVGSRR